MYTCSKGKGGGGRQMSAGRHAQQAIALLLSTNLAEGPRTLLVCVSYLPGDGDRGSTQPCTVNSAMPWSSRFPLLWVACVVQRAFGAAKHRMHSCSVTRHVKVTSWAAWLAQHACRYAMLAVAAEPAGGGRNSCKSASLSQLQCRKHRRRHHGTAELLLPHLSAAKQRAL
jgi:hypothetical protein